MQGFVPSRLPAPLPCSLPAAPRRPCRLFPRRHDQHTHEGTLHLNPSLQVCTDSPNSWMTTDQFYAGLALAQAMPGPLFNFAAYLGAVIAQNAGVNAIAGRVARGAGWREQGGAGADAGHACPVAGGRMLGMRSGAAATAARAPHLPPRAIISMPIARPPRPSSGLQT